MSEATSEPQPAATRTEAEAEAAVLERNRRTFTMDGTVGCALHLTYDVPLATGNLKDYEDFATHHGLRILGGD